MYGIKKDKAAVVAAQALNQAAQTTTTTIAINQLIHNNSNFIIPIRWITISDLERLFSQMKNDATLFSGGHDLSPLHLIAFKNLILLK